MATTPKWTELPKYPVIAGIAALAIGVTIAWAAKIDISPLFESAEIRRGQLWRLFTSVFPHLDILHLAFNLYWLWIMGTIVEGVYGHAKTAMLIVVLAVGSSSWEFALDRGGVGLSGVGYGLFGMLFVLSKRDERFRGALDQRTVKLFVGWFLLCILTTVTHMYVVANVAHGAGAVLGALLGYAITIPNRRALLAGATGALVLLGVLGSTLLRPRVNLSATAGYEEGQWGYDALVANRNDEAVRWLGDAVKYQPKVSQFWYDLGIGYHRLGQMHEAMAAYQRAFALDPNNPDYSKALEQPKQEK